MVNISTEAATRRSEAHDAALLVMIVGDGAVQRPFRILRALRSHAARRSRAARLC